MSLKKIKLSKQKVYTEQAKKTAARYALGNLCLHILLLAVIVQCVWIGRMGTHTMAQAKQHIFLAIQGYVQSVHYFFHHPKLVQLLSPYVWPYIPYIFFIVLANFVFSFKASRALKRGRIYKDSDGDSVCQKT